MIRNLEINNYKLFRDLALELDGGVNLLCGPNGSRKTSVKKLQTALSLHIPHHLPTSLRKNSSISCEALPVRNISIRMVAAFRRASPRNFSV